VTRFAAGDFSEQLFALYDLRYMEPVEDWTINWCHYDNIVNIDIVRLQPRGTWLSSEL